MKPVLFAVQDLHVQEGNFQLRDICFTLEESQYLVILGPTGCGKSMLLETLAGLRYPKGGGIFLRGKEITSLAPEARRFGFAYQDSLLFPFLNVKDNILFAARSHKNRLESSIKKRADELTEAMRITHLLDRYPQFLSGGEKQRVSLARALLSKPPLLLLDEPLSSLDQQIRSSIKELLRTIHNKEELGIIHVTHDFNEALQLGTHLLVMDQGRILQQGKVEDVFFRPSSKYLADFFMGENILQGRIEWRDGQAWFRQADSLAEFGPLKKKKIPDKYPDEVALLIHAGDLSLSKANGYEESKANSWYGLIERVVNFSTHLEVVCSGNGKYKVVLSNNEWKELNLQNGSRVKISVDVDDLHILPN